MELISIFENFSHSQVNFTHEIVSHVVVIDNSMQVQECDENTFIQIIKLNEFLKRSHISYETKIS